MNILTTKHFSDPDLGRIELTYKETLTRLEFTNYKQKNTERYFVHNDQIEIYTAKKL